MRESQTMPDLMNNIRHIKYTNYNISFTSERIGSSSVGIVAATVIYYYEPIVR